MGLLPREALERLPNALHARSGRTSVRAVGEEGDDRLVAHDAATIARSRHRRIGELHGGGLGHDRAIGKGEHGVVPHHVERAAHRGDSGRDAHAPERGADRVAARKSGTAHHDIRAAHPHERGAERERVLEGAGGGGVGGERVGAARSQMSHEIRDAGCGKGPPQYLNHPQTLALQATGGFLDALVGSLGEHDAAPGTARPLVHRVAKRHLPNFCLSAFCTTGWTSCDTSPPKRATSRTRLELRYVRSNAGTRNTVSILGARLRFMSAIWNSYSKSDTARNPRTITAALTFLANSASSPSNDRTSTRLSGTVASMSCTRSSSEKSGCLATFTATATISRSTNSSERRMRSSCPLVIGSKEPGYTAMRVIVVRTGK